MAHDFNHKRASARSARINAAVAPMFEALETRSMMAAQPIGHDNGAVQSVALKAAVRVPLARVEAAATVDAPELSIRALAPDQVRLSWTPVDGATSYRIERYVGKSRVWTEVGTTTRMSAVNSHLRENRLYRYHVVAVQADGTESVSETVSVRPAAALAHMAARAEKIAGMVEDFRTAQTDRVAANLDKVDDEDFRRSIRKAQRNFAAKMAEMGVTYRPMTVESLMPAGTLGAAPRVSSVPPSVTITVRSASELAVNWSAVAGGLSYKIERSADAGTTWAPLAFSTGVRFVDVGLTADTSYQYRVSVITAADTSAASAAVTGVTNQVAPAGLTAAASDATTVGLTWSTVANATSYRIERSINTTSWTALTPGTPLTGSSAAYTDATGAAGTTYYYRITTVNGSRSSAASDPVSATTLTAAPTLTATPLSGTRVNLTWTAQATAFEYGIERSDDDGTTWTSIATSSAAHFVDASLTANTAYKYRVSSTNAGGTSAASTAVAVTTLLATVADFAATPSATADTVTLDWTAVTDATSYRIDRSLNQTSWTTLSTSLIGTDATFDDTTALPGKTYSYRILAVSAGGNGAFGDPVSALVRPATPTGLTTVAASISSVTVAWTAAPTATSYLVEKSVDSGTTWTTVGTPSGTNIVSSGLAANVTVQYRVTANNATGASDPTGVSSITTAPETPANLAGSYSDTNSRNELSWDAVTDATSYVIERSTSGGAWTTLSTSLSGTDDTYNDSASIAAGTSYRYRISATNANGTSPVSGIVTVLTEPATPTLTVTATGATTVGASWTASTGAAAYTLQYSDDAGSTWTTAYTGANLAYTQTGLTTDTAYSYQVLATNATGDSDYSAAVALTTLLVAPANSAATTPNGTSVVLTWDAVTNATGYQIERSVNAGSTWTTLAPSPALTGTDVTYTDTGLTANTAYRYRISSVNGNGTSAPATAVNISTRVGTTATLTATTTSAAAIALAWTAVTGATAYKIETSTDAGSTWTDLVASQTGLTYNNTGLTANTSYSYRVSAVSTAGAGTPTAAVAGKTLLAAPSGFTTASPTNASVTLTWSASTGATGYKVERSANAGVAWTTLVPSPVLSGTDVTYTDTALTAATSYQYRLSAISTAGTSVATAASTVVTRTNAPVATGTVASGTQVNLNWAAVPGATGYVVQKSIDSGTNWTSAGTTTTALTIAVTGLTTNTPYLFRVSAANTSGNSAASANVSLRTLIGAPSGLATTSVTAAAIGLSWNVVTSATSYKLEKAVGTGAFAAITPATAFTGSTAAYSDTGLVAGTTYKYRISAINTLGTSVASGELSVLTRPAAPVVTATPSSTTAIALAWPAVTSATSYKIEISGDAGSTWSTAATQAGVTYNATGLNVDSAYSFRVSAINATGAGAVSTTVATRTVLAAPTGFTLLDTSSASATLAWTPSDNATSYILERSANAGTTWTTVVTTPALGSGDSSYEDAGLAGGTSYVYRLSAGNAAGRSAATSTITAVTLPAAPTLTAAATGTTAVSLTWTASTTATSYRVERSANAGATWTTIASPTGNSFADTGVAAARNYSYRVSAVNSSGVGDTSAEVAVATLLAAPTALTTTTLSATAISLAWTAPTGATGYKIERSADTNTWTVLTQSPVLAGTATYFSNTGLAAGTDYYYRITATGAGTIVSPTSSIVRGTTVLAAPTGLAAAATSTTAINLTWTSVTSYSRSSFKIQRSPNGTNSWTTIASPATTATSYSNTGLTSGTRYFYRLVAVSLAGDSAPSTVVNATTR